MNSSPEVNSATLKTSDDYDSGECRETGKRGRRSPVEDVVDEETPSEMNINHQTSDMDGSSKLLLPQTPKNFLLETTKNNKETLSFFPTKLSRHKYGPQTHKRHQRQWEMAKCLTSSIHVTTRNNIYTGNPEKKNSTSE